MRDNRGTTYLDVAPLTALLLAANIVIHVFLSIKSSQLDSVVSNGPAKFDPFLGIQSDVLKAYGASWREGLWDGGWHRFVLPMFLHGNLLHIVMNMWSLHRMGAATEAHFGSANFGTIYLLSGIGGICASLIFGGHLSVGASTSLFGIMGAYLAVKIVACWDLRRAWKSSDVRQTFLYIALNGIVVSIAIPNVDHWGHLGGFLMGLLFGGLFEYWRKHRRVGLALVILWLAIPASGIAAARWMIFNPHYHVHLGLKADDAGDAEAAEAHFEKAREWAKRWRSEPAAWEIEDAYKRAFRAQNWDRCHRLAALFSEVAPERMKQDYRLLRGIPLRAPE